MIMCANFLVLFYYRSAYRNMCIYKACVMFVDWWTETADSFVVWIYLSVIVFCCVLLFGIKLVQSFKYWIDSVCMSISHAKIVAAGQINVVFL
jgi:hypothetical protein